MAPTRRQFLSASALAMAGTAVPSGSAPIASRRSGTLRICFLCDAHLPGGDTLARLPDAKYRHQARIRTAFDRANEWAPDAFVFGGDNIFAVDQSADGGDREDNARFQFGNWKRVVAEKVRVPHHSVIGNHDIWTACPAGQDPKRLAMDAFGMPEPYFRWDLKGWTFLMIDVFGKGAAPKDATQMKWIEQQLKDAGQVCIVSHAPIFSVTTQLVGGAVSDPKAFRSLFLKYPAVRLALSGHNHLLDECRLDGVTYCCGGAVSGAWWEGDYHATPPAFLVLDLEPSGGVTRYVVYWEKA